MLHSTELALLSFHVIDIRLKDPQHPKHYLVPVPYPFVLSKAVRKYVLGQNLALADVMSMV